MKFLIQISKFKYMQRFPYFMYWNWLLIDKGTWRYCILGKGFVT